MQSGAGVVDVLKTADAPTVSQAGIFTQNCLNVDVTTADAAIAAGDNYSVRYKIEGYDFAQIAQTPFIISFWHKHTITGTYCIAVQNSGTDRNYIVEYTQTTTNTWEYSQIAIPASPSAGTWDYTTGVGATIVFSIAAGSTFQGAANTWQAGNLFATANQVNGMSANTNFSKIQLVQVRAGSQAQPWETRSEAQELALCQRYFQIYSQAKGDVYLGLVGYNKTTTTGVVFGFFPVAMRGTPTITVTSATSFSAGAPGGVIACTAFAGSANGTKTASYDLTVAAGLTAGQGVEISIQGASGVLSYSAEL